MHQKLLCGVKFCGGCNPRFERGAAYEKIKKALSDEMDFEYAKEMMTYDLLLVIGGCTNCCASYEQYKVKHGIVKLYEEQEVQKTIQILRDFE